MRLHGWAVVAVAMGAVGCGAEATLVLGDEGSTSDRALEAPRPVTVRLVFIHGVNANDDGRRGSTGALAELDAHLMARLPARAAQYEAAHPEVTLAFTSHRVNLYTDLAGNLVRPIIDDVADGTGVPSATRWREQLVAKLNAQVPQDGSPVVLIGHSTGAKVAMEVAANVGGAGTVGGRDWGWQSRIVGVVTINGMIDALNSSTYNFIAFLSYLQGCKAVHGDGWCEYSGRISAVPAATWVAQNKRALMLISHGSCSPSVWTGESDQVLPLRAQGVPAAYGMKLTPTPDTFGPAHGLHYGPYCHSDITNGGSERHAGAKQAVSDRIVDWLFTSAPRVTNPDVRRFDVSPIPNGQWSGAFTVGGRCGGEDVAGPGMHVIGSCGHPGFFDGDDHAFNGSNQLEVRPGVCGGTVRWRHFHSGKNPAKVWLKTYSQPPGGGLVSTL